MFRSLIWGLHSNDHSNRTIEEIASKAADDLSFPIDEDDIAEACETASGQ